MGADKYRLYLEGEIKDIGAQMEYATDDVKLFIALNNRQMALRRALTMYDKILKEGANTITPHYPEKG